MIHILSCSSLETKTGSSEVNLHRRFVDIGEVDRQVNYVLSHPGHVSVIVGVQHDEVGSLTRDAYVRTFSSSVELLRCAQRTSGNRDMVSSSRKRGNCGQSRVQVWQLELNVAESSSKTKNQIEFQTKRGCTGSRRETNPTAAGPRTAGTSAFNRRKGKTSEG